MSNIQEFEIEWEGIKLSVTHTHDRWGFEHLEIMSLEPPKAPLPITNTGYKSHFIPKEALEDFNSAKDYVLKWLEHEALKSGWQKQKLSACQYSLF